MFGGQARQAGDVERMGEEVTLGISEVRAVEPHVGLVEDTVEGDEVALALGCCGQLETLAIDQRLVVAGERLEVSPMAGHLDLRPVVVEVFEADCTAATLVVGNVGTPLSRQIHDGDTRRGPPGAGAAKIGMVDSWQHLLKPSAISRPRAGNRLR